MSWYVLSKVNTIHTRLTPFTHLNHLFLAGSRSFPPPRRASDHVPTNPTPKRRHSSARWNWPTVGLHQSDGVKRRPTASPSVHSQFECQFDASAFRVSCGKPEVSSEKSGRLDTRGLRVLGRYSGFFICLVRYGRTPRLLLSPLSDLSLVSELFHSGFFFVFL